MSVFFLDRTKESEYLPKILLTCGSKILVVIAEVGTAYNFL